MHRIVTVSLAYSVTILQKGIHQQQFRLEPPFESSIKASGKDTSDPPQNQTNPVRNRSLFVSF